MAGYRDFQTGEVLTAANVNDFLMDQSVMKFADASARDTALGTAVGGSNALREGMVAYLDDVNQVQVYGGTAVGWVVGMPASAESYRYAGTKYYTSSGTFAKADPLGTGDIGLRAIRVRVQSGGGGGGGSDRCDSNNESAASSGGGAGGYAESFITNISALGTAVTVTRGAGGSGGAAGLIAGPIDGNNGSAGGESSFGSGETYEVSAGGGRAGNRGFDFTGAISAASSGEIFSGTGDLVLPGNASDAAYSLGGSIITGVLAVPSNGADSLFGSGGTTRPVLADGLRDGNNAFGYGAGGGGGAAARVSTSTDGGAGGDGSDGIVIVDCYV